MNTIKKILVNKVKTRGLYEPKDMVYHYKSNPSNQKEIKRIDRRLSKINRFDDEETGEPPIENLTANKAKLMFKMLQDTQNAHRLSRKEMPKEEKLEYIKKSKEYSLFRSNMWRHMFHEQNMCLENEHEMLKSACILPMYLVDEVMDLEGVYDKTENDKNKRDDEDEDEDEDLKVFERKNIQRGSPPPKFRQPVFKENSDNIESIEFSPHYLYLPQIMRIYPDDLHIIHKTLINMPAYETSKQAGIDDQGDSLAGGANDEN